MAVTPNLLFRLAEFLRQRKDLILGEATSVMLGGSAFPWPKRLGQVVLETADHLLAGAAAEEGAAEPEPPLEALLPTGVQSVLLESALMRNAFVRVLNRFQAEQAERHDFTALEMTEARQQTLQEFDLLLTQSLADWIARENTRTDSINPHAVCEVQEGLKGVLGLLRLATESVPPSSRIHISAAVSQLTRLTAQLQDAAIARPGGTRAPAPPPPPPVPKPALPPPKPEPLRVAPLHVATFVRTLAEAFRPAAEQKGLKFESRCGARPEIIVTDAAKLHRAVSLILDHAVRTTDVGGIVMTAGLQQSDVWSLGVRDTGPGLPPEILSRMLLGLGHGDSDAQGSDGVLGIALARDLADLLGGSLEAMSTPQDGTHFRILLPLR